jgi:hypothetical protein
MLRKCRQSLGVESLRVTITANLILPAEMQTLRLYTRPTESEILRLGLPLCVVTSPPCESEATMEDPT